MRRTAALALLLLCLCNAACVRLLYLVRHVEEPLPAGALEGLRPGQDDLESCLRALGAPHLVWEYAGDGAALGWVWLESAGWDFDISWPFVRFVAARLSLDWESQDLPGAVLWFDERLVLERWRQGRMRELTSGLRRRPAPVEGM